MYTCIYPRQLFGVLFDTYIYIYIHVQLDRVINQQT